MNTLPQTLLILARVLCAHLWGLEQRQASNSHYEKHFFSRLQHDNDLTHEAMSDPALYLSFKHQEIHQNIPTASIF